VSTDVQFSDGKLPRNVIDELARLLPTVKLERDQVLYREGDPADGGLLLVSGRLAATVRGPAGDRPLGESLPGDVVGEAGIFLRGGRRRATLVAVEPSVCLKLDKSLFHAQAGNATVCRLERHLLRLLAERIIATDAQVVAAWGASVSDERERRLWTLVGGAR
jgi:CRP/FNR family transcriptional regulator, cyclic AMP receptor protein